MSGPGRAARDFVPVKEYFPDEEPKEESKNVESLLKKNEALTYAIAQITSDFFALRKKNEELLKELELEKAKKVSIFTQSDYDSFMNMKMSELKLIYPDAKYMELRSLASNEWKYVKGILPT